MRIVAGLIGGLILAIVGVMLIFPFAASQKGIAMSASIFFVFWIIGFVIALTAKSAPKAWRRLLLTSAILSFLPPLSGIIYRGSFLATHISDPAAVGAIAGGIVSYFFGFIGFFLGIVFLIIGLLVGR
jgi:hypothetical protein